MALASCRKDGHVSTVTFDREEITIVKGVSQYIYLMDGNGGYSWDFSVESVAEVIDVKNGTVRLRGLEAGQTVLTLTDCKGTSDTLLITVTDTVE